MIRLADAGLHESATPLSDVHDLAILDLDGVVYVGPEAVPGAADAISAAAASGLRCCYVTNNASRPPGTVAVHLQSLGVPARADDVVTSAQVAAALLVRQLPAGAKVLVVGGTGLRVALTEVGLVPVGTMADAPVAVVQGFSPDVDWRLLLQGTRAVRAGLPWIATNLDLTVPTPYGPAPGNGSLVGLISTATGKRPDQVAGKPQPQAFLEAAHRYRSSRPIVVGDRLDTDLEGANAAGMPGLAVLTGVSGASDLLLAPPPLRPRFLGRDLGALLQPHPPVMASQHEEAVTGRCAGAAVTVTPCDHGPAAARIATGQFTTDAPDALDVLRAACAATWAWSDAGHAPPDLSPVLHRLQQLQPGAAWVR